MPPESGIEVLSTIYLIADTTCSSLRCLIYSSMCFSSTNTDSQLLSPTRYRQMKWHHLLGIYRPYNIFYRAVWQNVRWLWVWVGHMYDDVRWPSVWHGNKSEWCKLILGFHMTSQKWQGVDCSFYVLALCLVAHTWNFVSFFHSSTA